MNTPLFAGLFPRRPGWLRAPSARPATPDSTRQINPVVLLHASGSSARQWAAATALLETHPARLQVHTVEFHGHGAQPAWRGEAPLTLVHEVALVEDLLQRLGGAHVVGHSYGAAVALKLACCRPALVRSVVAYEPVLMRLLGDDAMASREAGAVRAAVATMRHAAAVGDLPAAARRFVDFWSGAGSWASMAPERRLAMAARVPVLLQQFGALFADSMDARRLSKLRMPLLLLSGERTVDTARVLVRLVHGALPHAEHDVLPEMGHMGPVTHADVFNRRIADFLGAQVASHAAARAGLDRRASAAAHGPPPDPSHLPAPDFFRELLS